MQMEGVKTLLQYYFCNCALIIYICTIYLFYVKKRIVDKQSRLFEGMLWTGLSSCILDIISEVAINNTDQYPIWLIYLIMYLYYILQNSIPFLSSLYGLELLDKLKSLNTREKLILYTPVTILVLILLTNHWTGLVYYIDESNKYIHGIGFYYLFIQSGYYLIINILYTFYYRQVISKKTRFMVISISLSIVLIMILDLNLDQLMIQSFSISVSLLLLYIVIQNAEEELEDSTGLLTRHALIKQLQMDFINRYPFTIVLIKLEDKAVINYTIGTNYWFSLVNEVSGYLKSLDRLKGVYHIEDGLFAIKLEYELPIEEKDQLMQSITSKFVLSKWSVLNMDLEILIRMLEISYPKDIEEINDLFYYIEYFHENMISSENMLLKTADLGVDLKKQQTEMKKKLMSILDSFQYELCFMPIFSVSENRIIAREPLLKLSTTPPSYVSPSDLDHETEDYRKLRKIHSNIFEDICIYIKNNLVHRENHEFISINLAVTQLMQEGLLHQYSSIVREHQIDYHIFGIEISEVMDYYNQESIYNNIKEIDSYGIPFVLDQFGTGHSSLTKFKHIPFKYVKLDQSLIKKSYNNEKGISILKSIVAMMNSLHISVIADGVDTKEIADSLISLGVDKLQGTYYL